MAQLSAKDLRAALDFVGDAYSFDDLGSFRSGILPGLEHLVPADLVGYNEVYSAAEPALVITHPDPPLAIAADALARLAHQHPLISVQINGDDRTYKISDFLSRREFHSLELYDELYRRLGAEDQIAFGLPGPLVIGIALNRGRRGFSERDRAMLELLRPHLARAHGRLLERLWTEALLGALEHSGVAVLVLDRDGTVNASSETATELLEAYLPEGPQATARLPLRVETERGDLTVREAGLTEAGRVLVLEERRAVSERALRELGLTRRQAEILRLLAAGRGTGEIAATLFISPRTVRKHQEHIYERLGVHSREEAVAAARKASEGDPR